jgi:hypothetical protein
MAHELDITDGQVAFANSRSDHWHRLGQSVSHAMTAREALDAAHLAGWNVRKMALQVPQQPIIGDDGVTIPPPVAVLASRVLAKHVHKNPKIKQQLFFHGQRMTIRCCTVALAALRHVGRAQIPPASAGGHARRTFC